MWYYAHVLTSKEFAVAAEFQRFGAGVYFPILKCKIRLKGKKAKRNVPGWPGYLCVDEMPSEMRRDRRLIGYLESDGQIATASNEKIKTWQMMERLGVFQKHFESEEPLGLGESIIVAEGLLTGWRGVISQPLRGKDEYVEVSGGDFPKPIRLPVALISPQIGVE